MLMSVRVMIIRIIVSVMSFVCQAVQFRVDVIVLSHTVH
jgi:hypothetical protein